MPSLQTNCLELSSELQARLGPVSDSTNDDNTDKTIKKII